VQFSPDSDEFALDTRLPGYRWFELTSDGGVKTGVNRLTGYEDDIDYTSSGY
jgi:Icc protein